MSVDLHEEAGGKVVVVNLSGKLSKDDYAQFVPEVERLIKQKGKLRMLVRMHDFHGWTVGGLVEDIKFDWKHFSDIERLASMVNDPKRPVQFVFAGKAHPHDEPGKRVLQQIAELMRDPQFAEKFVFVEDYDINVGRHFVQGVDVWLNNPRRPLEASGTSGQKVVLNGGLNLSILDGWWAEAYDGLNGFAIGTGHTHSSMDVHDTRDGDDLYRVLREDVIPLYYQRDRDGLPRGWIKRMKRTIRTLGWRFNADRMVMDYTLKCYVPAAGGISSDMRPVW